MTADLSEIVALVRPPSVPTGLDRSWEEVEAGMGTKLPDDYKAFVDVYGSGLVCGRVAVWNFRDSGAFHPPLRENLASGGVIALYKTAVAEGRCYCPYRFFPEAGGLLPFGTVVDVHHFNWLTEGEPNAWEIVYWFFDGHEFIHLQGDTFSRFLLKVLRGSYEKNMIPRFHVPCEFTDFSHW